MADDTPTEELTRRRPTESAMRRLAELARLRSGADIDGDGVVSHEERATILDQRLRITERLARYALAALALVLAAALLASGALAGLEVDLFGGRAKVTGGSHAPRGE